ncbi:hypothetical protein CRG98_023844 [Punica granatum]|uniref:Integrase catalytic domain-containing protein n=1 Tax=Punica granatum TaxID=22663 RepID=A0A2I0JIE8_PUNGR|nr:hypothetical protein CRG98_023844 [Punica granatum]
MATSNRKFLIMIDLYSKWVEAEPLATITKRAVIKFFRANNICHFGVPHILISDNGTLFKGKEFKNFYDELHIGQCFDSVGHPESNSQTKNANKTLLHGLLTRIEALGAAGPMNFQAYSEIGLYSHRVEFFRKSSMNNCAARSLTRKNEFKHLAHHNKLTPKSEDPHKVVGVPNPNAYVLEDKWGKEVTSHL